MNVRRIILSMFMNHIATDLALPPSGVVVVTGDNGAGKSTFTEAVATALWGESLRGAPGWRTGVGGSVTVELDDLTVIREKRSKGTLSFHQRGHLPVEHETATKAQEALAPLIGPFDVWRRSSVFSSADAAHFTLATDAERKRLLEGVLGLDRFDPALKACRAELSAALRRQQSEQAALQLAEQAAEFSSARLADARASLAGLAPTSVANVEERTQRLDSMIAAAAAELREAEVKLRDLASVGGDARAEARQQRAALDRLAGDICPTCQRSIPDELRDRLANQASWLEGKARSAELAAEGERADLRATIDDLAPEVTTLREKRGTLARDIQEASRYVRERRRLEGVVAEAEAAIAEASTGRLVATTRLAEADTEVAELQAAEKILGLRGFRATVLEQAVKGIGQIANYWLGRLSTDRQQLVLESYETLKSGATNDCIGLNIVVNAQARRYDACSGGERRRADVALLLALAEVASAANGRPPGTLWFDEVFDALDPYGVEAVCDALADLSVGRAVVLITHNDVLAERVQAVQRVRVAAGEVVGVR